MKRFSWRWFLGWLGLVVGLLGASFAAQGQDCMRWVQRQDVGNPGPQSQHCMAYDRDAGVTVLFTSDSLPDLWQYDGTNWLKLNVSGPRPPGRLGAALAYDPVRHVLMLAGGLGRDSVDVLADTWTFARTGPLEGRWTRQGDLPSTLFPGSIAHTESGGRFGHRMAFDVERSELVLFGGEALMTWLNISKIGRFSSSSRLVWSGADWRRDGHDAPVEAGSELTPLTEFAMAYDSLRKRMVLHGGLQKEGRVESATDIEAGFDGLCVVSPRGLKRLATRLGRLAHRMVYDARRDRYVGFGGLVFPKKGGSFGDTPLESSLPYFEFVPSEPELPNIATTSALIPKARVYHDMVYDERRGVTVMYGGSSNPTSPATDLAPLETWELGPLSFLPTTKLLEERIEICCGNANSPLGECISSTISTRYQGPGTVYIWRHWKGESVIADPPSLNPYRKILNPSSEYGLWDLVLIDRCGNSITSNPTLLVIKFPPLFGFIENQHVCPGEPLEVPLYAGPDSWNLIGEKGLDARAEGQLWWLIWERVGTSASGEPDPNSEIKQVATRTPLLQFGSFRPEDNGFYRCRFGNDCLTSLTVSGYAELTAGVWIKRHPQTTTNDVCSQVSIGILASGKGPLSYQWRRNGDLLSPADPRILGADTETLTFKTLRYLDDANYDCIVRDSCSVVTSRVASVGVVPNPPFLLVQTNGPAARDRHAMVYDSSRGVSVMFGGSTGSVEGYAADTWEYDGIAWVRRNTVNSPSGRVDFGMAFDRDRKRVVIFGGRTNSPFASSYPNGETWEYDGTNWAQRFPANAPAPRAGQALFYDPVRRVTTLYGGDTLLANPRQGDVWTWDGTNWTRLEITGERPLFGGVYGSPTSPQMVWDERRGYAVLTPQVNNVPGGDHVTWTWDGTNWFAIPTPFKGFGVSPAQTSGGLGLVYDRFRGEVIYWSGAGNDLDLVWRWNGSVWRRDSISSFIGYHISSAASYDERRNSVVMFGGRYAGNPTPEQPTTSTLTARTFERLLADEPQILRQPSVTDDRATNRFFLRVTAAGEPPLSYEWQRDGVKLLEVFPYSGTTNALLQIDRILSADAGKYRCVVRGKCGETASRATTLAGILEESVLQLSFASAPVLGQPGLLISWASRGAVLERATTSSGPWTPVNGAVSPYIPTLAGPAGYFRLRAP